MQEIFRQKLAIARGMWDRRWIGLAVAWGVAVLGGLFAAQYAERYEAVARVFVNTSSVLRPLIEGLTVQPNIDQQLQMLGKTLISRPNMEKLVDDPKMGFVLKRPEQRDFLVEDLLKGIKISTAGRENLFNISYRDIDPDRAHRLVEALVQMFVQQGVGNKREDAAEARKFIDDQIKTYESKLVEAENRLKEFKLKHLGYVTSGNAGAGGTTDHFQRMNTLQEELNNLSVELRAAEQSRDSLKRQLNQEESALMAAADSASITAQASVPEVDQRIDAQRKQLDDLLRRFTDQHPDVQAVRRTIAALERQKREELEARARDARNHGRASTAGDPVLQKIRIALAEADANVAALRTRVSDRQVRLGDLRSAAGRMPQVEAELAQLNRDYDVMRRNYDQLVARRESASIGVAVDETSQLAEFRIVEPARLLPSAVFPSRKMLVFSILVLAFAAGLVVTFVLASLHPTVQSLRSLREITQRPVLGVISYVPDERVLALEARRFKAFVAGTGALVLIHFAWIVWLSMHSRL